MNTERKIELLEKLLKKSRLLETTDSSDAKFIAWKNLVERTLINIFGDKSKEVGQFNKLKFYFPAVIYTSSSDYTQEHIREFKNDMQILTSAISEYIEDFKAEELRKIEVSKAANTIDDTISKVFISHSSKDTEIVEEVIDLLEAMGLDSTQIFCTSFAGYGIDLGGNFLDEIKNELNSKCIVLFIISENFYTSPVCLCEMGATWVLAKKHIPILVPPIEYSDVKGVIPTTQGLVITEPLKLNLLKDTIQGDFNLSDNGNISTWERKRDRVLKRINELISKK